MRARDRPITHPPSASAVINRCAENPFSARTLRTEKGFSVQRPRRLKPAAQIIAKAQGLCSLGRRFAITHGDARWVNASPRRWVKVLNPNADQRPGLYGLMASGCLYSPGSPKARNPVIWGRSSGFSLGCTAKTSTRTISSKGTVTTNVPTL